MAEKPSSPDDALAQFAAGLRQLRHEADDISYRRLAERTNVSPSALSQAASGRKLPTWHVTQAFVKGCGGDEKIWYEQWSQVRRELNARQSTANGQIPASAPVHKAPDGARRDTTGVRQSSVLTPASGPRNPHPMTFRTILLVAVIIIVLLTGAIAINWIYGQQESESKASDSPPVIPTYINKEYQGVAGLYETPNPSLEALEEPPFRVGSGKLDIVCQVSDGLVVRAAFVNAAGATREEQNDVWYRVLPSNYYVPAVYTTYPFGVEGRQVPGERLPVTIRECPDVP